MYIFCWIYQLFWKLNTVRPWHVDILTLQVFNDWLQCRSIFTNHTIILFDLWFGFNIITLIVGCFNELTISWAIVWRPCGQKTSVSSYHLKTQCICMDLSFFHFLATGEARDSSWYCSWANNHESETREKKGIFDFWGINVQIKMYHKLMIVNMSKVFPIVNLRKKRRNKRRNKRSIYWRNNTIIFECSYLSWWRFPVL